jgi:ribosomal protein L40E
MFCGKCGAKNPDDANYCHNCGLLLYKDKQPRAEKSLREPASKEAESLPNEEQLRVSQELLPID